MKRTFLAAIAAVSLSASGVAAESAWLPSKVERYSWNTETGSWVLSASEVMEYDEWGRLTVMQIANSWRNETAYNADSQVETYTQLLEVNGSYQPQYRNLYEYDERVKHFCVFDDSQRWSGSA